MAGRYKAICDVCGFTYYNDELRKRWDGLMVCEPDFETRHPQDFVRARPDQKPLPFTRPENTTVSVEVDINATTQTTIPTGTFTSNNNTL